MNEEGQAVAICTMDSEVLSEVTAIFKKIGIVPFYYRSLKEFWEESLKSEIPSLVIFDVRLMSDGNLALKSHPLVKSEKLPICFVYSEETEPLLFSTYEIFNLGLIRKSDHILGQMKAVLKRFNKIKKFEKENVLLKKENEQKYDKIGKRLEHLSESDFFSKQLKELCDSFSGVNEKDSFLKLCAESFEKFDYISRYSFYQITGHGKQLVSPDLFNFDKYLKLPSLWPVNENNESIDSSTQKMGLQVAAEVFENNFVSIYVRDEIKKVKKMIFLTFKNEDFYQKFDCSFLESFLDGLLAKFTAKEMKNFETLENNSLNFWSFLSRVDKNPQEVINLDLRPFFESLSSGVQMSWEEFMRDFIGEILRDFPHKLKYAFESHNQVYFFAREKEKLFLLLKEVSKNFSYRRYIFSEDDELFSFEKPSIKMVNLGSEFIRKRFRGEDLKKARKQFRPSEFL